MAFYLFLLFTVVPLAELSLLVWLGWETHLWVPILIIFVDAILGATLIRWQGLRALERIQEDLRAGHMPADAVIDGVLVLAGGLLLITPGMLTDLAGFALLIPPIRAVVKRLAKAWAARHVQVRVAGTAAEPFWTGATTDGLRATPASDQIIDARVIQTHVEDV